MFTLVRSSWEKKAQNIRLKSANRRGAFVSGARDNSEIRGRKCAVISQYSDKNKAFSMLLEKEKTARN